MVVVLLTVAIMVVVAMVMMVMVALTVHKGLSSCLRFCVLMLVEQHSYNVSTRLDVQD